MKNQQCETDFANDAAHGAVISEDRSDFCSGTGSLKFDQRLMAILNALQCSVYTVSVVDGKVVDTIHYPGISSVTGYNPEDFRTDPFLWINMIHEDDRAGILSQVSDCISGQTVEPVEHRVFRKDGQLRWLQSSLISHYDDNGSLVGYDGLLQDVTRRRLAEDDLKSAAKLIECTQKDMEDVNRKFDSLVERANLLTREAVGSDIAKTHFLANMSHEIRTPMNSIVGFAEMLANVGSDNLTEDQRNYIAKIQTNSESLLQLISDILDYSRIEAGQLDVNVTECSLKEILVSVETLMRDRALEKKLEFRINCSQDAPEYISTDPACLRQCLINLIGNAIKFTQTGSVDVNVSAVRKNSGGFVRFDVKDTGIGIDSEKQKLIFDKFMRLSDSFTDSSDGIGLGLAISKQLSSLLGGKLTLESTPGKGSTFSLTVPAGIDSDVKVPESVVPVSSQRPQYSGHVLIVEDSHGNQELIDLQMKLLGLNTTIAEDGQQAVDAMANGQFDLILMDIRMPVMNGYDATRILRERGVTTPIIALTAFAMKGDEEKCIEAGCDNYLAKPVRQKELHQMVGQYLSAKRKNQ